MKHIIKPKQSESMLTVDCNSETVVWHICGKDGMWREGFFYTVVEDAVDSVHAF